MAIFILLQFQFEFCHNLSFVTFWDSEFGCFWSFFLLTIWIYEICQNFSFWVLSQFHFLNFVTICFQILSQFEFLIVLTILVCHNLLQFELLSCHSLSFELNFFIYKFWFSHFFGIIITTVTTVPTVHIVTTVRIVTTVSTAANYCQYFHQHR